MEYAKIRQIIQQEYEKQTTDTNYNFISRFARAVYEAQQKEVDEILDNHKKKSRGSDSFDDSNFMMDGYY